MGGLLTRRLIRRRLAASLSLSVRLRFPFTPESWAEVTGDVLLVWGESLVMICSVSWEESSLSTGVGEGCTEDGIVELILQPGIVTT